MNPTDSDRAAAAANSSPPGSSDIAKREVLLQVLLETFDLYVRSVAEIAAETGLTGELTIEVLMAYGLALPAADELIHGFIRGDLSLFPPVEQNRHVVDRDTRRLELEAPKQQGCPAPHLGKALDPLPSAAAGHPPPAQSSALQSFIEDNPEVFRQVRASSREFLVRWVMLYLMEAAQARQRVHRIARDFWKQFPDVRQRIKSRAEGQSPSTAQRAPGERNGIGRL